MVAVMVTGPLQRSPAPFTARYVTDATPLPFVEAVVVVSMLLIRPQVVVKAIFAGWAVKAAPPMSALTVRVEFPPEIKLLLDEVKADKDRLGAEIEKSVVPVTVAVPTVAVAVNVVAPAAVIDAGTTETSAIPAELVSAEAGESVANDVSGSVN